jgi:hypothetical protein
VRIAPAFKLNKQRDLQRSTALHRWLAAAVPAMAAVTVAVIICKGETRAENERRMRRAPSAQDRRLRTSAAEAVAVSVARLVQDVAHDDIHD